MHNESDLNAEGSIEHSLAAMMLLITTLNYQQYSRLPRRATTFTV